MPTYQVTYMLKTPNGSDTPYAGPTSESIASSGIAIAVDIAKARARRFSELYGLEIKVAALDTQLNGNK